MNEGWKKSKGRPAKRFPKKHVVALRFTEPQFELLNAILDELREDGATRAECFEVHIVEFLKYQLRRKWRCDADFLDDWAASLERPSNVTENDGDFNDGQNAQDGKFSQ